MNNNELTDAQKEKFRVAISRGYFKDYSLEWRSNTLAGCILCSEPKYVGIYERLLNMLGKIPEWRDITDLSLQRFIELMQEDGLGMNSARTYCAYLKSILRRNLPYHDIPSRNFNTILTLKEVPTEHIFLDRNEIERIHLYNVEDKREKRFKSIFMISTLTGARYSDAQLLTKENIDRYTFMLHYVQKKTLKPVTIPVDDWLCEYLPDNLSSEDFDVNHYPSVMIAFIKKMCQECAIDKSTTLFRNGKYVTNPKYFFASTHTARRSFATNLYLAGVEVDEIRRMMGHSSEEITRKYIVAQRPISLETQALFNRKKLLK